VRALHGAARSALPEEQARSQNRSSSRAQQHQAGKLDKNAAERSAAPAEQLFPEIEIKTKADPEPPVFDSIRNESPFVGNNWLPFNLHCLFYPEDGRGGDPSSALQPNSPGQLWYSDIFETERKRQQNPPTAKQGHTKKT
jgi:hypothetical protein